MIPRSIATAVPPLAAPALVPVYVTAEWRHRGIRQVPLLLQNGLASGLVEGVLRILSTGQFAVTPSEAAEQCRRSMAARRAALRAELTTLDAADALLARGELPDAATLAELKRQAAAASAAG